MRRCDLRLTSIVLVGFFMFSAIFGNAFVAEAATKILSNFSTVVLTKEDVGEDIYLQDVITLNNNQSFVGIFADPNNYEYYYGSSQDMVNWDITSKYFSLIYGNGAFVGITSGEKNQLHYTKDGQDWRVASLPSEVNPMAVKFENGFFKLTSKDAKDRVHVSFSKDAVTWYDLTNEVPEGGKVEDIITAGGKIYSIVGTSISGDSVKVYSTTDVDESTTTWTEIETLKKPGYGMESEFFFNGESVGIQLYSLADYNENGYVSEKLYYMTNDFINWGEKDWTEETQDYYSAFRSTSTETKEMTPDSERFQDVEILHYDKEQLSEEDWNPYYFISSVIYSKEGTAWLNEIVNIFVNGVKVSKEPPAEDPRLLDPTEPADPVEPPKPSEGEMPNGTVVIGEKAFHLGYANNPANQDEMSASVVTSEGKVYVIGFNGEWIDNNTGEIIDQLIIPAVEYKDASGSITTYKVGNNLGN